MRRVRHHCDGAEAVAAADTLFDRCQRFDWQAAFDVRIDEALRQTEGDGKIALGQTDGDLLAVALDEKILTGEPLEKFFPFGAHEKSPEPLAGARYPRLEHADLTFPLWLQQIVGGTHLAGLHQVGI